MYSSGYEGKSVASLIKDCLGGRARLVVATTFEEAEPMVMLIGEGWHQGSLDDEVLEKGVLYFAEKFLLDNKQIALVEVDGEEGKFQVLFELIKGRSRVLVCGGGHVGQAVSLLGSMLGYEMTVVDDRPEFLSQERLPFRGIRSVDCQFSDMAEKIDLRRFESVVIVTRGHQYDEVCLRAVIGLGLPYVGMIGSKRRVHSIISRLERSGVDRSLLTKVRAPIGLDIGARSPEEIAIAILAEIIQVNSRRLERKEYELTGH
jgi:xanthine dehydrogenase accessory factor